MTSSSNRDQPGHCAADLAAPVPLMLQDMKILLVEDCEDNKLLVIEILRRAGCIVQTACNGEEGLHRALAGDYDLVLMDIQMPVMDGLKATVELRRRGFRKPIIALTAYAMRSERERCLAGGFDDHLTKPVNRQLLMQRLCDILAPALQELH